MTVNSVDLDIFDALVERMLRRSVPLRDAKPADTSAKDKPANPRERS